MKKSEDRRLQGTFQFSPENSCFGELILKRGRTNLGLSSKSEFHRHESLDYIRGQTLDGRCITCIDCAWSSRGTNMKDGAEAYHYAHIFPHYVTVGDEHLDPLALVIEQISFTTDDLPELFYDFGSFGTISGPDSVIDTVLAKRELARSTEIGAWPQVAYYTGKVVISEVSTGLGKVAVCHRPAFKSGSPTGVSLKSTIYVSIEPDEPIAFEGAMDRITCLARFLSGAAGRVQGIKGVQLRTLGKSEGTYREPLRVHWSFAPKSGKNIDRKPHPGDVPLKPVNRPEEFSRVLANWIKLDPGRAVARNRYISCLQKGNSYGVDRLVAAANMFDVLPNEAVPLELELPKDLAAAQVSILEMLKMVKQSHDRDSAIAAIKRLGRPSLPKKVAHRAKIVSGKMDGAFPDLAYVLKQAVACRNHFVHGSSDSFDFNAIKNFVPFLTDALEFTFAAADLIEAGWDSSIWVGEPYGAGHSFARFRWGYREHVEQLRKARATPKAKSMG